MKLLLKKLKWNIYVYWLLYSFLKIVIFVSLPLFVEYITQSMEKNNNLETLIIYVVVYFLLIAIIDIISNYLYKSTYTSFNDIRRQFLLDIHSRFMDVDYNRFQSESLDDLYSLYSLVQANEDGIEGFYHNSFEMLWQLVLVLWFIFYLSQFSWLLVVLLIIFWICRLLIEKQIQKIDLANLNKVYEYKRKLYYFTYDVSDISYGKEKRIYNFSSNIKNHYQKILNNYEKLKFTINSNKTIWYLCNQSIDVLIYVSFCYFSYRFFKFNHQIEKIISLFLAYILYNQIFDNFIHNFINNWSLIKKINLFNLEDNNHKNQDKIVIDDINEIEFVNVSFGYDQQDLVISNCSFKIKKGENVALLGLNGAGKSTLLKLLLGLLKPTHGQILINGIDLVKIDLNIYWSLLTYIEQETNLISISVYDFLRADNQNFNEEKALLAIEKVGLLDKINSYPNKIHTLMTNVLTKDGVEFSGGQLQKMLIARSLCREKSCLYLFDEPTSALDNNSEINTYNQLKDLCFNKIGLFISHRLKTTQFCQRVMILKDGQIIEDGNQKQLLNQRGFYYRMLMAELENSYEKN